METFSEIAKECVKLFCEHIPFNKHELVIEPNAGDGSFIPFIKKLNCEYFFYNKNSQQDFLQLNPKHNNYIHIIGKPPFERNMAIKYIKKSCEFAKSISFILPKSFKKENQQQHFGCYFHCIHEWGEVPDNCVFQIWIRKEYPRTKSD
jgi:hypothetical protein